MQNPGNSFTLLSLIYCILLLIIYFAKPRVKNIETKIYSIIVIICLVGNSISLGTYFFMKNLSYYPFWNELFARSYLVFLIIFTSLMTYYVLVISINNKDIKKYDKKLTYSKIISLIYAIAFVLLVSFLPIEYVSENNIVYSSGLAVECTYLATRLCIIIWIIILLLRINRIKEKKYWPMLAYIALGAIVSYIQGCHPEYLLTTSMVIFVTFLMYFTIENPDMKMIEELNIARDQAEKANLAKSEFLSSMSHEIRTPLNAIVGFSQSLQEYDIPNEAKEEVNDIISASESLLDLVNGILDISKIEANKLEIVNDEYSINKVLNDVVALTKARMGTKELDFQTNFDSDLPPILYGDHTRIKQIIINLLTNSVKYTKEGFINFTVNTIKKGDICRLIISVEDSGIGIKKENIDKLFTKFERFEEKNTTTEGTGLGLAITKKLIELMNGKIIVHSVFGKGSKFTVAIDQKIVKNPTKVVEEIVSEEKEELDLSNKKVLVVDDNKLNIKVANRLLQKYKVQLDEAYSGFECLDKISDNNKYDLILLDDMMPKMSGVETIKKLREKDDFNIPIVILTANAITGMREKYISTGFDDYLSKPIDRKELDRVLRKFLNK